MTEQGETIAQKFANRTTATYNLELLLAGVTGITLRQQKIREPVDDAASLVGKLSEFSRQTYRELLKMEGFIDFFRSATPIDALELAALDPDQVAARANVRWQIFGRSHGYSVGRNPDTICRVGTGLAVR